MGAGARRRAARWALALAFAATGGCDASPADGAADATLPDAAPFDAAIEPFCPQDGGSEPEGDDGNRQCGTCSIPHAPGQCAEGYLCTSWLACVWFKFGFPYDAGVGS